MKVEPTSRSPSNRDCRRTIVCCAAGAAGLCLLMRPSASSVIGVRLFTPSLRTRTHSCERRRTRTASYQVGVGRVHVFKLTSDASCPTFIAGIAIDKVGSFVLDANGSLYVMDRGNDRLRRIAICRRRQGSRWSRIARPDTHLRHSHSRRAAPTTPATARSSSTPDSTGRAHTR